MGVSPSRKTVLFYPVAILLQCAELSPEGKKVVLELAEVLSLTQVMAYKTLIDERAISGLVD